VAFGAAAGRSASGVPADARAALMESEPVKDLRRLNRSRGQRGTGADRNLTHV
jgi:hypothetical protein